MTVTEMKTKVPVESVVDVEGLYGRPLLAEVAAVTSELAGRQYDLHALVARAAAVVRACTAVEDSVVAPDEVGDSLWQLFNALSGLKALSDLAGEIGIHDAIFEPEGGPA